MCLLLVRAKAKVCVCVCLLLVRAKAKIKRNKYGATRSAGDYRRKVQLARLCALGGKDMVGEVKCVKEGSVRGVRSGTWGGRDGRREVQVDAHRRCLSHDVSDLALEAVEESCAFGVDCVRVGLR